MSRNLFLPLLVLPQGCLCSKRARLTALQETRCSILDLLGQLTRALQVVEDEDVWCKQNHVLLTAAKRHGQELIYVLHGATHDVTWTNKSYHYTFRWQINVIAKGPDSFVKAD